ncbi:MAG: transketolase [Acidobacteriaceae bacterium]
MNGIEVTAQASSIASLERRALALRRHVLRMGERVGQGYVGQGLGIADLLAVLYFGEMKYDPNNLTWPDRDRFLLSIGHYSIGLYAALAEAGVISVNELDTYGADQSRLEMAGSEVTPGFEMTGGSLGHGLGQAVGMALGLRLDRKPSRIFNLLSDGELQEGSTWESAMSASHYRLDNLFAFIDCNNQQADGAPSKVLNVEPVHAKWDAFGWDTQRIDGNNVGAIVTAIEAARNVAGKPHAIVLDTLMGKGVRAFEEREKNHFIRVEPNEWQIARRQLEEGAQASDERTA